MHSLLNSSSKLLSLVLSTLTSATPVLKPRKLYRFSLNAVATGIKNHLVVGSTFHSRLNWNCLHDTCFPVLLSWQDLSRDREGGFCCKNTQHVGSPSLSIPQQFGARGEKSKWHCPIPYYHHVQSFTRTHNPPESLLHRHNLH